MSEFRVSHLPVEEINRLRFKAFMTNSQEDVTAYYKAASLYFQDRDTRAMNRADRIEELEANAMANRVAVMRLEAKLAKAVEFTKGVIRHAGNSGDDYLAHQARTTLAELKGQDYE